MGSNPRTSGALYTGVETWVWKVVGAWARIRFDTPKSPSLTHTGDMETTKMFYPFVRVLRCDIFKRGVWWLRPYRRL